MLKESKTKFLGVLRLKPTGSLMQTGALVCESIRGLELTFDDSGRYEEYPALTGTLLGVRFALLGEPGKKIDEILEENDVVELMVSTDNISSNRRVDLSEHLLHLLDESGLVAAWIPEKPPR